MEIINNHTLGKFWTLYTMWSHNIYACSHQARWNSFSNFICLYIDIFTKTIYNENRKKHIRSVGVKGAIEGLSVLWLLRKLSLTTIKHY